jgi:hypothetical protein
MAATIYKLEIQTEGTNSFTQVLTQGSPEHPLSADRSILVKDINFNAQMYAPNSLEVVLSVIGIELESYTSIKLSLYKLSGDQLDYTAKNYYVVNKRFKEISTEGQKEYVLKAYSADYFLTIDKFCQAFTGKTLNDGIIKNTLEKCKSDNLNLFRNLTSEQISQSATEKGVDETQRVIFSLQNFSEKSIIPYAVQYNESFYDFLVRLCNKDGEFLYFGADNKIHIGLGKQLSSLEGNVTEAEYIQTFNKEDNTNWVDVDYLGKYQGKGNDYIGNFNATIETENSNISSFCGVLAPEYLENLKVEGSTREDYAVLGDYTCWFSGIAAAMRSFFVERNVCDSVDSTIKHLMDNSLHIGKWLYSTNSDYDKKFKDIKYLYADGKRNNARYKEIYNKLEKTQSSQVTIKVTGEKFPYVGDVINYNNVYYVVYKLNVNFVSTESQGYDVLLVKSDIKLNEKGEIDSCEAYPMPLTEKRIRKASAQRAIVMDNFDPSRLGRVRVKYPWQKDIKASDNNIIVDDNWTPWIRVSTPMASDGAGFLFTPSINDEVLVDFENSDIECPYISGAFYNDNNRPSIASQSQTHGIVKSITSTNGHHISFTDNAGAERYVSNLLPFAKMLTSFGFLDKTIFNGEYAKYFGGGFEISDYYGIYSISGSSHNRSIDISSPFGTVSIDAFQGITINAPLGDVKIVGKNVSIEARNNLSLISGTNIEDNIGTFYEGKKFNKEKAYDCFANGLGCNLFSDFYSGFDLSVIRNYLEVILRPIGGTMLIKSNRYMRLEAGDGKTSVDEIRRSYVNKGKAKQLFFNRSLDIEAPFDVTKNRILDLLDRYKSLKRTIIETKTLADSINEENVAKRLRKEIISGDEVKSIDSFSSLLDNRNVRGKNRFILSKIRDNAQLIKLLSDSIEETKSKCSPEVKDKLKPLWSKFKSMMNSDDLVLDAIVQINKKELLYKELKYYIDADKDVTMSSNPNLGNLSKSIKMKEVDEETEYMRRSLGVDKFLDLYDDKVWTTKDKGAILFSDNKDNYFKIGEQGSFVKGENIDKATQIINIINSVEDEIL